MTIDEHQHVAWCRYVPNERTGTRIVLCDSDASGAFPVFPKAAAEKVQALLDHERTEVQRLTAYVEAFRREERRADDAERDRDDARAEVQRLTTENASLKDALQITPSKPEAADLEWAAQVFAEADREEVQRLTRVCQEHGHALQRAGTAIGLDPGSDMHRDLVPAIARLTEERDALRQDAARGRLLIDRSEWRRYEQPPNDCRDPPYAILFIRLPYEADLSCKATREDAIDAVIATQTGGVGDAQEGFGQWIPVTERLPNYGEEVLLYRPDAAATYDPIYTLRSRRQGSPGPFEFLCVASPSHWMPLLPPPTAAQQGGER